MAAAGVVKSAARTLEVLEYFAASHAAAGVGEIARALGYPQSSTSVLLGDLARLGYLEQDAARRYRPTLRVMLLGGWMQDRLIGDGRLLRRMEALRARHGVTVLIGMQASAEVRYILTLRRPGADATMRAGMTRPIGRAAVGKALLMPKPDAEVQRILRRANAEASETHRVRIAAVIEDLRASRLRGWTESGGAVRPGQNVLAMPLPPLAGQPPMAIGLGAALAESERQRTSLVAALRQTCNALGREARVG
jgi:DNA-binding IclR family transcriptional regulator